MLITLLPRDIQWFSVFQTLHFDPLHYLSQLCLLASEPKVSLHLPAVQSESARPTQVLAEASWRILGTGTDPRTTAGRAVQKEHRTRISERKENGAQTHKQLSVSSVNWEVAGKKTQGEVRFLAAE